MFSFFSSASDNNVNDIMRVNGINECLRPIVRGNEHFLERHEKVKEINYEIKNVNIDLFLEDVRDHLDISQGYTIVTSDGSYHHYTNCVHCNIKLLTQASPAETPICYQCMKRLIKSVELRKTKVDKLYNVNDLAELTTENFIYQ